MPSVRNVLREQVCNALGVASYVAPALRSDPRIEWLFCLTLPNSGSTAFAKMLESSAGAITLTDRAEAEWLVPSLCDLKRRWDPALPVWTRKVRARWMLRAQRYARGREVVVIEKSPATLARYAKILDAFSESKVVLVILVRDPYAVCASWHKRYGREQLTRTSSPELAAAGADEGAYFEHLAQVWLARMRLLASAEPRADLVVRYDDLMDDPQAVLDRIQALLPRLSDAHVDAGVRVKDYPEQKLTNMDEAQIATLTPAQIASLSKGLQTDRALVERFGYAIREAPGRNPKPQSLDRRERLPRALRV